MDLLVGYAKKYNVKLIDVAVTTDYHKTVNMPEETFIEHSCNIGDEIIIGLYNNPERRLVSFFHEVGHTLYEGDAKNKYDQECRAWQACFRLLKEEKIPVTEETTRWCREQLKTYIE